MKPQSLKTWSNFMCQVGPFSLALSHTENGVATSIEHIAIYCQCCTGILYHVQYSKRNMASNAYRQTGIHTRTHTYILRYTHTETYTYKHTYMCINIQLHIQTPHNTTPIHINITKLTTLPHLTYYIHALCSTVPIPDTAHWSAFLQ